MLLAEAKVYVGTNLGVEHENYTNDVKAKALSPIANIHVGYGVREAYSIQFGLEYVDLKPDTSVQNINLDGKKYGLNVSFIKAVDLDIFILPYAKVGFGAGFFEPTEPSSTNKRLNYGSYNIGTGFYIPLNKKFDFEVGYDYKYISHEATDKERPSETSNKSHISILYIGFNARF